MRIARGTIVHVLAGEVIGVFAHIERADEDRAGGFETAHQHRIARRRRQIAVDFRAGAGRQAGNVDEVLHRERYAGKRPERLATRAARIERLGALASAFRGDVSEGIDLGIDNSDPRERRVDNGARGDFAGRYV
jgi:hypothetical protein